MEKARRPGDSLLRVPHSGLGVRDCKVRRGLGNNVTRLPPWPFSLSGPPLPRSYPLPAPWGAQLVLGEEDSRSALKPMKGPTLPASVRSLLQIPLSSAYSWLLVKENGELARGSLCASLCVGENNKGDLADGPFSQGHRAPSVPSRWVVTATPGLVGSGVRDPYRVHYLSSKDFFLLLCIMCLSATQSDRPGRTLRSGLAVGAQRAAA